MSSEESKAVNTDHPLLKRFSNPHFNAPKFVNEIVSRVDTKGLEGELKQLNESKKMMNDIMGDLLYKKYGNILKIDTEIKDLQGKAEKLNEELEEYKIAVTTLEVNIQEEAARAQKGTQQYLERDDDYRSELDTTLHSVSGISKWFEELPEKIGLLLAEGKYQDCLTLFQEYQKNKQKQDSVSLLLLKDCEQAFGRLILALTKEVGINPNNVFALKSLGEMGFMSKGIVAYLNGKSKILKLKLKEYVLINESYKAEVKICQLFLSFLLETKRDFERCFDLDKESKPLCGHLTKWMLDELRKFVLVLTELLFKTTSEEELKSFTESVITIFKENEKEGICFTIELQRLILPYYRVKIKSVTETRK